MEKKNKIIIEKNQRKKLVTSLKKNPFEDFFDDLLEAFEVKAEGGQLVKMKGQIVQPNKAVWLIFQEMWRVYDEADISPKPTQQSVSKAFEVVWPEIVDKSREEAIQPFSYDKEYEGASDEFLSLITDNPSELEKAAFKHFIWQVKRKALDKEVPNPLWLNLYGPQGSGKTTAFNSLFKGIEHYVWNAQVGEACDSRAAQNYSNKLVIFCDEIAGSAKAEIETIKQNVTSKYIEHRPLYSNFTCSMRNRSSFASASNKPLNQIIKDSTGARRFFEITTKRKMEIKEIINFDVSRVWKSVNEDAPSPLTHQRKALEEFQEGLRHISPLEDWYTDKILPLFEGEGIEMKEFKASDILKSSNRYMEDHNYKPYNAKFLSNFLIEQGIQKNRKKNGAYYTLPAAFQEDLTVEKYSSFGLALVK